MLFLTLSLASLVISLLSVVLIKQRFSKQFLDLPNDRSSHTQPTPRGGGLGFIIGFALTSLLAAGVGIIPWQTLSMWLVIIPLAAIGIVDDRQGVPASARYLVQLGAAGIAIAYFGSFPIPWLDNFGIFGKIAAIALTLIGMTATINFYNFMDGLDGLVAGCVAIQLSFLALYTNQPIFWLLVAAIGGFLYWNWSPAKIFMGDVGSTVLGATVAIALLNQSSTPTVAWSALAITLPLAIDAIYTLCRRLLRGENIFQAHRSHVYQRLQQSGLSHDKVAILYMGINGSIAASIAYFGATGALTSLICTIFALLGTEIYLQSLQQKLVKNN